MKKTTTILLFTAAALAFSTLAKAQYSVTTTKTTYTELVSPTVIASGTSIGTHYMLNIPGSFTMFGKPYGLDYASTQGVEPNIFPTPGMTMTEANSNNTNVDVNVFTNCSAQGLDATSSMSYQVTGDTKTGMIKYQWKNMGIKGSGAATDFINVQLWMNRADNTFTIVFGPNQITGSGAFSNGGVSIGADQFDATFDHILGSVSLKGDPAAPTLNTATRSITAPASVLTGFPTNGTTYTFKYSTHTSGIDIATIPEPMTMSLFPNPAHTSTKLGYALQETGNVHISLLDITGKEIKTVFDGIQAVGVHEQQIETAELNTGIYYCRLYANGAIRTEKVVVLH